LPSSGEVPDGRYLPRVITVRTKRSERQANVCGNDGGVRRGFRIACEVHSAPRPTAALNRYAQVTSPEERAWSITGSEEFAYRSG